MPQLSPIFWMVFPFISFLILMLFFMEIEESSMMKLEYKELDKSFKGESWKW